MTGAGPRPPAGYSVRPAGWDDLGAVLELFRAADLADWGDVDVTEAGLRNEWEDPGFDFEHDTWLVFADPPDGPGAAVPAGYGFVQAHEAHRQIHAWGVVHPDHRGRGLGAFLMDLIEARAAEHADLAEAGAKVVLRPGVIAPDRPAHDLMESRGYRPVRHFWQMTRTLEDETAPMEVPGIRIRPFAHGPDDRAFHAAVQESFADHWGFVQRGFDEWSAHRFEESAFDPALWFVAEEDEEIAGILMGSRDTEDEAWVGMLGVRSAWRRRGIGEALLRRAFENFRARGFVRVSLGVDAANATGATALYERVGMHVRRQYDVYEKRLR